MRVLPYSLVCYAAVFVLFISVRPAQGQLRITSPDTTICPNTSANLRAHVDGRAPARMTLTDDLFTGVVPIGFSFNFFGNDYSQCIISSNGYISFNTNEAAAYSPWEIKGPIPGNTNSDYPANRVTNSIMGFYADIRPRQNDGTLDYSTIGTAPNRQFVISFCDVPMYSCTTLVTSFQIILHETTNEIDVHIANAPNCPDWNDGYAIEGIQNANGTVAYTVPGRNFPNQWTAYQSSHKWTPTGGSNYTVTTIPYEPVPNADAIITWYANGTTRVDTGSSISVTPDINTFYVAQVTNCQDTISDTVRVVMGGGPTIDSVGFKDPSTCGGGDGSISLSGLEEHAYYSLHYRKNGVQQNPVSVVSTATGDLVMSNLYAGVYDSIILYRGACFSNVAGPVTLKDPPVIADWSYDLHLGCESDTLFITNNSVQNTFNVWDFGNGTNDTAEAPVHIIPVQGVYQVKLVVSNGVCSDSNTQEINTLHPLIADFTVDDDSVCAQQTISFTNTSTANYPSYVWDFGDGNTSTEASPMHVFEQPGAYRAMLIVTDQIPCSDTAFMNIVVDSIPYISFAITDSVLCEGREVVFDGNYLQNGNTGITWDFGDGITTSNIQRASHAYDSAGVHTVTLSATYRNCEDVSFTRDITTQAFPSIGLGPDTAMCPDGEPIIVGNASDLYGPSVKWKWNTGDTTAVIVVRHPGTYSAQIEAGGCVTTDSIQVLKDCYLDMPNSFTPNNDGLNDYFLPRQLLSKGVSLFKMSIYSRWGQLIFETTSTDGRGWDGRFNSELQPEGVYIYRVEVTVSNGRKEQRQGNVTLIR